MSDEPSTPVQSAKDRIRGARRPRRTGRLNLRGDLRAEADQIEQRLVDLRSAERVEGPPRRLGQKSEQLVLAERLKALHDEMGDSWLDLVLEAVPFADWREFKAANPPSEEEYDRQVGVDFTALVSQILPRCVVEPELDAEDWRALLSTAAPGDLRDLGGKVYALHETGSGVPLSLTASAILRTSGEPSEPPAPGASPSAGTPAGSPPSSTRASDPTDA